VGESWRREEFSSGRVLQKGEALKWACPVTGRRSTPVGVRQEGGVLMWSCPVTGRRSTLVGVSGRREEHSSGRVM